MAGAKLYVTSVVSREATQELGRWMSSEVMGKVYSVARADEVAPEMRVVAKRASDCLNVGKFLEDLDDAGHYCRRK